MTITSIIVKEINGKYISEEDRILLRIKTNINEEYRFWLTRNITKILIIEMNKHIFEQQATKLLEQEYFSDDNSSKTVKSKLMQEITPLKNQYVSSDILPLGAEPILIHKLELRKHHNNHNIYYVLTLKLSAGIEINCPIQLDILNSVQNLIEKLTSMAGWVKWIELKNEKKININLNDISQSMH